jgi:hypothetical protein
MAGSVNFDFHVQPGVDRRLLIEECR